MKQKINKGVWCIYNKERVSKELCSSCEYKEYKNSTESLQRKMQSSAIKGKKHKLTKATDIPTALKKKVWERDKHRCIFCGVIVPWNFANSHYIKRSQLGLGIEQNIMTNCERCHKLFEESSKREEMKKIAKEYFLSLYPDWNEKDLIFSKYKN